MTKFEVDEEYIEEVNTSYDQDKEIGEIPSAYFAHSEPMNAKNGEEKLNKNGTGIKRSTRGVNPKKTKAKVLQFVYVSKSECEICREYDGMAFATDSPNRPIIPRLESQGNRGSRPYTHPNCKCKWVRPFSDAGMKNFDDIGLFNGDKTSLGYSGESGTYAKVKSKLYKRAVAKYGDKFFKLPKSRKHYIIMQEIMKELKSHESFHSINLLKTSYDTIQPSLNLDRMRHTNEVRHLIDDMIGESISSEKKHGIVLEHNLDFTFENLLEITEKALFETLSEEEEIGMDVEMEFTDDEEKAEDSIDDHLKEDPDHYSRLKSVFEEHDVWDEETNTLIDPSILEDKEESTEGGRGSGKKGHQKWMLGAEADPEECPNCMIFTEKKNGNCQICGNSY
jgi:hypothetical protein